MGCKLSALAVVLSVIALTIAGVAVGQVIGGAEGALIGAIPGALAAVLAGLVPVIVETARRHQEERARREREALAAREKWKIIGEPVAGTADRGPAALLRPDREVVKFTGRKTELGVLRSWCTSGDARSVRTIVGAGGAGKSRLALELAAGGGPGRDRGGRHHPPPARRDSSPCGK